MAGLTAATTVAPAAEVVVLESTDRTGGRVDTVRQGDYWINVGNPVHRGHRHVDRRTGPAQHRDGLARGKEHRAAPQRDHRGHLEPVRARLPHADDDDGPDRPRRGRGPHHRRRAVSRVEGEDRSAGARAAREQTRVVCAQRCPFGIGHHHRPVVVGAMDGLRTGRDGRRAVRLLGGDRADRPREGAQLLATRRGATRR
nr:MULTISPECIES: FAD-dependent oxidoreductase [Nocardia]